MKVRGVKTCPYLFILYVVDQLIEKHSVGKLKKKTEKLRQIIVEKYLSLFFTNIIF